MTAGRESTHRAPIMVVVCPYCRTKVETDPGVLWVTCSRCHERINLTSLGTTPRSPEAQVEQDLAGKDFGKYHLEELIGIGGMGVVYRATDDRGGTVAVKILYYASGENENVRKRFDRETEILGGLDHRGIVRLLGRGQNESYLYIAMEYIPFSLAQRLKQSPLSLDEIGTIMADVADALSYAHDRKIVHRDLKPTNILLSREGAKISDFGIAHVEYDRDATSLTQTAAILGTFNYMSPEQRLGEKDIDKRSDIYSLGVLLYELLTGRVPIGSFPAASGVRRDVPSRVDGVIAKALSQERSGRYEDARRFKEGLMKALSRGETRALQVAAAAAILVCAAFAVTMLYLSGTFSCRRIGESRASPASPALQQSVASTTAAPVAEAMKAVVEEQKAKAQPPEKETAKQDDKDAEQKEAKEEKQAAAAVTAETGKGKKKKELALDKIAVKGKEGSKEDGYFVALTKPSAKIIVDGEDTGRQTPVTPKNPIVLPSGSHKVTFVLPTGESHDFNVKIVPGEQTKVTRNFEQPSPPPKIEKEKGKPKSKTK